MNGRFQKTQLSLRTSGIGALADQQLLFPTQSGGMTETGWLPMSLFYTIQSDNSALVSAMER
ncbi:hypothetical protein, partial [Parasphingorhabdus sp.]|uniref:hypothetical protein n=1 Tax=Parasphingorhabdus sp. TaxID=2709688 RepID=UPI003002470D